MNCVFLALLGLSICNGDVTAQAQTYGQVLWGQQQATTTPSIAIFDGTQNVAIGQLNTIAHTFAPAPTTISGLPAAGPLSGPEIVPLVQGGVAVRSTVGALSTFSWASPILTGTIGLTGPGKAGVALTNDYLATYAYFGGNVGGILSEADFGTTGVAGSGFVGATRTKGANGSSAYFTGNTSWFFQDNAAHVIQGAGQYTEARRYPTVIGPALAQEVEITEFGTSATITPYAFPALGSLSADLWLGSGGGTCTGPNPCFNPVTGLTNLTAVTDATVAINLLNNGASFRVGINFGAGSLTGDAGGVGGGFGHAINLERDAALVWYAPNGTQSSSIIGDESNSGQATQLRFGDTDVFVTTGAGHIAFDLVYASTAVNYLRILNGATGFGPDLMAQGTDTNIDILFAGKGTGVVDFHYAGTTGAGTQTFTNSPCTGLTTETWIPIKVNGVAKWIPSCS